MTIDRQLTIDEMRILYRRMRGIEEPCERCHGTGGQSCTQDICDLCWGSGDKNETWLDLRTLRDRENEIRRTATLENWFGPGWQSAESVAMVKRVVLLLLKECRKRNVTFWEDMHIRALAGAMNRLLPESERENVKR